MAIFLPFYFADNIPALHDLWIIGDKFLCDVASEFHKVKYTASRDNRESAPLFISEFFNVHHFNETRSASADYAIVRIVNNLIQAMVDRKCLPRYLLIVPDKDVLNDIENFDEQSV